MPYVNDADFLCDKCHGDFGPSVPLDYIADAGERDSPCHCEACGQPIDCSLTDYGMQYVLQAVRESIEDAVAQGRDSTWDRIMPMRGTGEDRLMWWHGSRHVEIVRGWAKDLRNYSLEPAERALVDLFLELSEKP